MRISTILFMTCAGGLLCFFNAKAQTVILTSADFAAPGDFAEFHVNASPTGMVGDTLPGTPGVVDVLDLTGQAVTDSYTLNFVTPGSLPAGGSFPTATVGYTSPTGVSFYLENSASSLKILGTSGVLQGQQLVAQFSPGYTLINYPCSLGTSINTTYSFDSFLSINFDSLYNLLGTPVQVTIDSAHVKRKATVRADFHEIVRVLTPEFPSGTLTLKAFVTQDNYDSLWLKLGAPISIPAFGINYPADWIFVDNNLYTLLVTALGYDPGIQSGRNVLKSVEYFAKFRRFRFASAELNPDASVKRLEWISNVNNIGLNEGFSEFLQMGPNPFRNVLVLQGNSDTRYQLKLMDLNGRLLENVFFSTSAQFSFEHLASGVYVAEVIPRDAPGMAPLRRLLVKE